MLKFLKKKNTYEFAARTLYAQALSEARKPKYYTQYGVPDSFDGRFDLLLVHLFCVIHVMAQQGAAGRDFNQALFDVTFADMDQTLRERGIGDMGIPKHMRRMMKAFNGRMHAYEAGLNGGDLEGALVRNLYGTLEAPNKDHIDAMAAFIRTHIASLNPDVILRG